jgi:hypothetical protein
MSYEAEISRENPTAFFFLVDQSFSMQETLAGTPNSKSVMLATIINRLINNLVIRSSKGDEVFDYFDVALIGYGNSNYGGSRVGSAFGGPLANRDIVPLSEVADYPIRIEQRTKQVDDGAGGLTPMQIEFPVWLEPVASHDTPMNEAMSYAFNLVSDWVAQHPKSFPPVVLNITDGQPTDSDPRGLAQAIQSLSTDDGEVLIFSLHLSTNDSTPIIFPNNPAALPDDYARLLFEMSSPLPHKWSGIAAETMGMSVSSGAKAFVYNATLEAMIRFLEIGTRQPTKIGN